MGNAPTYGLLLPVYKTGALLVGHLGIKLLIHIPNNNNLSYVIIALQVLYFSITPTDQSIDFPSSYLIVGLSDSLAAAQQMEFQALPQSSLSLTDYFKLSIIILNFQLLQFHLLISFNVLSSYMSFCLCQQPFEKQKTAFF